MKRLAVIILSASLFSGSSTAMAAPNSLQNLLLSSAWCAFSYNQTTGYSSTTRVQFYKNKTYSVQTGGEGYSDGYGGTFASQSHGGGDGNWNVKNGTLYMSEGDGPMEAVNLRVTKNSNGYPILKADGKEYSQCN